MTRRIVVALLVAVLLVVGYAAMPTPAYADQAAAVANVLAVEQAVDVMQTRAIVSVPGCYERDPLMRGLSRSDLGMVAAQVVVNLAARLLMRRSQAVTTGVRLYVGAYPVTLVNNARVMGGCHPQAPVAPVGPPPTLTINPVPPVRGTL